MDVEWHIYTLVDPRDAAVRYVGWSRRPKPRLVAHISLARKGNGSHRSRWIRGLLELGLRPAMAVVESGKGPGWADAERRWIADMRQTGARLTNMTDGGEGAPGWVPDAEWRAKMSRINKGRKHSPQHAANVSAGKRGVKFTAAHCAAMAAVRRGKVPTIATEAARIAVTGTRQSPEHVAKRVAATAGKGHEKQRKLSAEDVQEIRSAMGAIPQRKLAAKYGVGTTTIHSIQHRTKYQDVD